MSPQRRSALAAALALALAARHSPAAQGEPQAVVAWPRLRLLDGTPLEPAHWQGRAAVIVFWATWCAYCKRHNDRLNRLYTARGEGGPRVLAVAVDGDAAAVARHVRAQGWSLPVALDDGRLRPLFTERRAVPFTVLVGADGRVRERIPGEMSEEDLRGLLRG